jgi:ABC-type spermidine/putrescine transport system permease subunit II
MFLSLRDEIDPTIAAISSILIILSIAVVCLFQFWEQGRVAEKHE